MALSADSKIIHDVIFNDLIPDVVKFTEELAVSKHMRQIYPDAFTVLNPTNLDLAFIDDNRKALIETVREGDILLYRSWYWGPYIENQRNKKFKEIYIASASVNSDIDHDGDVDGKDLASFVADFGQDDCIKEYISKDEKATETNPFMFVIISWQTLK